MKKRTRISPGPFYFALLFFSAFSRCCFLISGFSSKLHLVLVRLFAGEAIVLAVAVLAYLVLVIALLALFVIAIFRSFLKVTESSL